MSTVKDWWGVRWDTMYIEIALISLQTLLLTTLIILLHRGMSRTILTALIQLDNKIAEAIQQVVSGNIELAEPPNPLQALLVEAFKNNMIKKNPNVELVRGEDGKFK